jgi:CRP/FNR family transcriptional regulator
MEDGIIAALEDALIFQGLAYHELMKIAEIARLRNYHKEEVIINEGEIGSTLYIVRTGSVKVFKTINGGQQKLLCIFEKGDFFGEIGLFDTNFRTASIIAGENGCYTLEIEKKSFDEFIKENATIARKILYNMLVEMARRIRMCDEMIKEHLLWLAAIRR